ncbi:arginine--tRNA ligase [Acetobacteroides hydrogenigenes]|uniref:Arginine--tRNA ligase n=1 Tax=Acetobacteroides hydrogenigenes TaxID=979970 RepID=A0A4R2EGI8_9BACT|nr:arginine--tRNA ligase [Acetobacteroides hydrogenigenes]TCN65364.1 arginyl-tRNA synthetase [Acetobacteroides hydrogenigenes]
MNVESIISDWCLAGAQALYGNEIAASHIQIQKTKKDFEGDYTLIVFPFVKLARKSPEAIGKEIGEYLLANVREVSAYNVIKGFLNIALTPEFWADRLNQALATPNYGIAEPNSGKTIMVEYSSPNTNKPLHLGHVRNNLLGNAVSKILKASGKKVYMVNLVNDRGIHICKSMIAWKLFGNGETPESTGKKGDHLVGDYYVRFDKEFRAQVKEMVASGMEEEEAKKKAPILLQAQDLLRKWEAKDVETINLWSTMNGWVYEGFEKTYNDLGITFDRTYYESQTYLLGKELVMKGLEAGVFFKKEDGSVWIDLTDDGLDQKLLLRGDGTSVYMTQDLGTAHQRFDEYTLDEHIYVVGNEQNYHFQVLRLVLKKLGFSWADSITHLSYGMVELPEGKMKSREGTVVDADELVDEMVSTARQMSEELGKLDGLTEQQAIDVNRMVGLGALKYFILKVDPKKTMMFDPKESIDFNGNTGPFIQYTHARIKSLLRKAKDAGTEAPSSINLSLCLSQKEIDLIKMLDLYPEVVSTAADQLSPAIIANYAYDMAKEFNQFYHDSPIIKEDNEEIRQMRLALSQQIALTIKSGMSLLGIEVPEKM